MPALLFIPDNAAVEDARLITVRAVVLPGLPEKQAAPAQPAQPLIYQPAKLAMAAV